MLMRCVAAWAVHEFLFEPKSPSGGRSAAAYDLEKTGENMQQTQIGTFNACAEMMAADVCGA